MNKNQKITLISLVLILIATVGLSKFYFAIVSDLLIEKPKEEERVESKITTTDSEITSKSSEKEVMTTTETTEKDNQPAEKRRAVALTFDDGPHKEYTPQILSVLEERNVSGTFFLLGNNVREHPEIVKDIQKKKHEIGNHSTSHPELTTLSREQLTKEITTNDELIKEVTGEKPKYVRPPYGAANQTVASVVNRPLIQWSVDTQDWASKNKQEIIKRVKADVYPGSIILMHDIHPATIDALPEIIRFLKDENYEMLTISDLLNAPTKANNYYGIGDNRPVK